MIIKLIDMTRRQVKDMFGFYRHVQQTDERLGGRNTMQLEIRRARRFDTPVSLIAIRPGMGLEIANIVPTVREAKREFDVISDDGINLLLLLPNTDAEQARQFAHRLRSTIDQALGVSPKMGIGTFPEDALTLQGLVHEAQADLGDERVFLERPRDNHFAACGMCRVMPGTSSTVL